jgi:hypothetical protein
MTTNRRPVKPVTLMLAPAAVCWLMPSLSLRADAQDRGVTAGPHSQDKPSARAAVTDPDGQRSASVREAYARLPSHSRRTGDRPTRA